MSGCNLIASAKHKSGTHALPAVSKNGFHNMYDTVAAYSREGDAHFICGLAQLLNDDGLDVFKHLIRILHAKQHITHYFTTCLRVYVLYQASYLISVVAQEHRRIAATSIDSPR
jgi:hypothetical protein